MSEQDLRLKARIRMRKLRAENPEHYQQYNARYYEMNKSKWRDYNKRNKKKAAKVRVWHDGGWVYKDRRHPFAREVNSMNRMRQEFMRNDTAICWWCGDRPIPISKSTVQVDHVSSMCYISPRAVVCSYCNLIKRNILPSSDQLHRLFYSDRVVRDVPKESMKKWCDLQGNILFGKYAGAVGLILTKIVGQKVRRKGNNNSFTFCHASNSICEKHGIP